MCETIRFKYLAPGFTGGLCVLSLFVTFIFTSPVFADDLYDIFRNPPAEERPFFHWDWPAKVPGEEEIIRQLDVFKNSGFGGVEIAPAGITLATAKSLKFAADEARKRELLVDLALTWPLTSPSLDLDECAKKITLDKKFLKGPMQFHADVNDLINPAVNHSGSRLMFLRLISLDIKRFTAGGEFIDQVKQNGSIDFNIPDGNYALYIGVLSRQTAINNQQSVIDPLNGQVVEKYFNNLSAALAPSFGGNLGDTLHAISFNKFEPAGTNWTSDFEQQFVKRRGYNLINCLPVIFDNNITDYNTDFYETIRQKRYDFYITLTELLNERFLAVFNDFCRGNGVLARFELPENSVFPDLPDANLPFDIALSKIVSNPREHNFIVSTTGHFAVQPQTTCRFSDDPCLPENQPYFFGIHDIAFVSGINQFICTRRNSGPGSYIDRNARLCAVFRNSRLNIRPTVEISPANPSLLFISYVSGNRDIFFFTNIDRSRPLSFNARFETGDKIPWLWNPLTGSRNLFHSGSSRNSLDIELDHLDSILLVFEPNLPDNPPALNIN